eukprot:9311149-Pyramimonas_sp.AAC.1
MKGRQACWFQAVGFKHMVRELWGCSSERLQTLLNQMPDAERANLVQLQHRLVQSIVEELAGKLSFHSAVPCGAARIYRGQVKGGSTEQARVFCKECLDECDNLMSNNK